MYPGLPRWYAGGKWVGMNYFSSKGISMSITGNYKIVRTPNSSYAPGHQTVDAFARAKGLTFVQAGGESFDRYSLYVCLRPTGTGGSGGSGGGGDGGINEQQNILEF